MSSARTHARQATEVGRSARGGIAAADPQQRGLVQPPPPHDGFQYRQDTEKAPGTRLQQRVGVAVGQVVLQPGEGRAVVVGEVKLLEAQACARAGGHPIRVAVILIFMGARPAR